MQTTPFHRLARLAGACALIAPALFAGTHAAAQATGGPSAAETTPPGASKPPSKEAIDACTGKTEGDRVTFTDAKNKKRKWVCTMTNGVLAARSGIATPATKVKPK
jgi:hypothetical protein